MLNFQGAGHSKTAVAWILCYLPASFVTQLWAGSQFSPGQGED